MANKLTQKQENFCQQYILTGNAAQAYRNAYDTQAKPETVQNKAYVLLKRDDIRARVEILRQSAQKEFTVSAEEKRKLLYELAMTCSQTSDDTGKPMNPSAVISAIAELNKMDGHLAAIKQDIRANVEVTHEELLDKLK